MGVAATDIIAYCAATLESEVEEIAGVGATLSPPVDYSTFTETDIEGQDLAVFGFLAGIGDWDGDEAVALKEADVKVLDLTGVVVLAVNVHPASPMPAAFRTAGATAVVTLPKKGYEDLGIAFREALLIGQYYPRVAFAVARRELDPDMEIGPGTPVLGGFGFWDDLT